MAIRKQEFYEGAALHKLIREGAVPGIRYVAPFFIVADRLFLYLKYSTKNRSPWGFTFTPEEQLVLTTNGRDRELVIGLVCGADGIAALSYEDYQTLVRPAAAAVHIACYRSHNEHYEVNGPDGQLAGKIAPSRWQRTLER